MARRLRDDEHTAWLDLLVDLHDPFIAAPVSRAVLGDRLPKLAYAERDALLEHIEATWAPNGTRIPEPEDVGSWCEDEARWMLGQVLGYAEGETIDWSPEWQTSFSQSGSLVTLRPTAVIHAPDEPDKAHALVFAMPGMVVPDDPDDYLKSVRRGETVYEAGRLTKQNGWHASVVHRATRAANAAGVSLVLVTNGRFWTVVAVHDDTVGYATFDLTLFKLEPPLRRAFVALLHVRRQFAVATGETLTAILEQSLKKQKAVTTSLGKSVRQSAEVIVASFSGFDQRKTDGELLRHVPDEQVYEAAVTVIMRLVFLFYAEENGLFPLDNATYRDNYAASTLRDRLAEQMRFGSAKAQRSSTGWHRLLALFRAVHDGVDSNGLRIFGYGGSLFDPDRYPFLEGRIVNADGQAVETVLPELVDDAALFEIVNAITIVDGRPLSFQSLDVEQIGHVYESLLDHSAVRAQDIVLGMIGKDGDEPEVDLTTLEAEFDKGPAKFAKWYEALSGKAVKAKAVTARLAEDPNPDVLRGLLTVCGGDQAIHERVLPFANLLRLDLRRLPLVILPDGFFVTETPMKSDTGTAYTTKELATEIAKHALDPLLYEPGPHNEEDESKWVPRSPDEILALRFCDPAIGSAAIIVAAVRYAADVLVRSRELAGLITADQMFAATANSNMLDVKVEAARDIVARCVYGVDINPMAVEMAKMSLWLITMAKDQPFTFLDHAIKCGNALLGITDLDQLRRVTLAPEASVDWVTDNRNRAVREGRDRRELAIAAEGRQESMFKVPGEARQDAMFAADERGTYTAGYDDYLDKINTLIAESRALRKLIRSAPPKDRSEAEHHAKMHAEAQAITDKIRLAADAITAACLSTAHLSEKKRNDRIAELPPMLGELDDPNHLVALQRRVEKWKDEHNPRLVMSRSFFHWPIEFPEVFENRRFDAMVGNPPFLGGKKISGPHGSDFREHLAAYVAGGVKGSCDLVGYFFRRAESLATSFGLLATKTIWQGDTRLVALDPICSYDERRLYRAESIAPWPVKPG